MMSLNLWLIFAPACFVINLLPGPNNMMAMSNGSRFGTRAALLGGVGRVIGFGILIGMTIVGLGAVLAASASVFLLLKYVGAAYLVYLGIRLWRAPVPEDIDVFGPQAGGVDGRALTLARREFFISITNPKAILTFTALFPQFLDTIHPAELQLATMGGSFLIGELISIFCYAAAGHGASLFLRSARGRRLLNRGSGCLLMGAGMLLAFAGRRH